MYAKDMSASIPKFWEHTRKLDAIRGAVLGGYINVLVTDKKVAEKLLENQFETENAILKCRIDYKVV